MTPKAEQMPNYERQFASREEVIQASKQKHGTPKDEAERMVAEQMGYPAPESFEQKRQRQIASIRAELKKLGVSEAEISLLLTNYPLNRIEQQLQWLPYRRARKPAALIVAAVASNYEAPAQLYEDPEQPSAAASSSKSSPPDK